MNDMSLSLKEINSMRHCIGLDRQAPYRRNNLLFYKPYRNAFLTSVDGADFILWKHLESLELACRPSGPESRTFSLTDDGFELLSAYMDVTFVFPKEKKEAPSN